MKCKLLFTAKVVIKVDTKSYPCEYDTPEKVVEYENKYNHDYWPAILISELEKDKYQSIDVELIK